MYSSTITQNHTFQTENLGISPWRTPKLGNPVSQVEI